MISNWDRFFLFRASNINRFEYEMAPRPSERSRNRTRARFTRCECKRNWFFSRWWRDGVFEVSSAGAPNVNAPPNASAISYVCVGTHTKYTSEYSIHRRGAGAAVTCDAINIHISTSIPLGRESRTIAHTFARIISARILGAERRALRLCNFRVCVCVCQHN